MSAFVENGESCEDCYGAGTRTTNWSGELFKGGPVICQRCFGSGENLTSLGRNLADFLQMWEKRKK